MSEKDLRTIYTETMASLMARDESIVLLEADLASAITTHQMSERYQERIINCGIQEANMIGSAAGLSVVGLKPYVHSFAPFVTRRAYDQVFLSIGYAKQNVVIIGSDGGVSAEHNGGTHMPFEDIALMRAIPNSTVLEMSDAVMFKDILTQSTMFNGLTYIRIKRKAMRAIYREGTTFKIGTGKVLKEGHDAVIVATGIMLEEALNAAEICAEQGYSVAVIDMFSIKPLDHDLLKRYAKLTGHVITAENHNLVGGLHAAVCESLAGEKDIVIDGIGVDEAFGQVGLTPYLKAVYHLTAQDIANKILT